MKTRNPTPGIPRDLQSQSDADLVASAREGEKWAFVEIVARYQATVSGVALAILRDFAASEDAAQETFLAAWKKIGDIREPEKLRAWLTSIARTTALGHVRRRRPSESLDATMADDAESPDEATASREEKALVLSMLDALPENYRLPLVLFYREEQSIRAVAEALDISESAAKKRLSRGRELLRDNVATKIDRVLGRTLPTAIFTMSIAAAIGALGQPSAIAATVFSTAAVAQTATTTAATTAAMTISKLTLATAAAIAAVCFPIGYHARTGSEPEPTAAKARAPANLSAGQSTADLTKLPASALVAEWIRLHEKHGSDADALPHIHAAILSMGSPFRRRALLAALAGEWAELAPESGLEFYRTSGGRGWQLELFANEWVKKEGWDAVDAIVQMPGGKKWSRDALVRITRSMLPHLADREPAAFAALLEKLPKPGGYWDNDVREAVALAASSNLAHVRAAAEQIEGPNRKQALEGVALAWAEIDGAAALQWAQTRFEGAESSDIARFVLTGWAKADPVAALGRMQSIPAQSEDLPDSRTTTATMVLEAAAEANFDATLAWMRENPASVSATVISDLDGAFRDRLSADTVGFLSQLHASNTLEMLMPCLENALLNEASVASLEILAWLDKQESNAGLQRLRGATISTIAFREPVATVALLDAMLTNDPSTSVDHAVRNLFNGGELLDRLDLLLPVASETLQQKLLRVGFTYLQEEYLSNPEKWLDRLDGLEKDHRNEAVIFLSRAWSGRDPLAVADWLKDLTAPGERASGFEAMHWQWAKTDAYGASEWIAGMQAGSDRDASILGLVSTIAQSDPDDAWAWVASIDSSGTRVDAAKKVLRPLVAKDPDHARAILDQAAFSPAEFQTLSALFK